MSDFQSLGLFFRVLLLLTKDEQSFSTQEKETNTCFIIFRIKSINPKKVCVYTIFLMIQEYISDIE